MRTAPQPVDGIRRGRQNRSHGALLAPLAASLAALLTTPSAAAADHWQTLVVGPGQSVSVLLDAAGLGQGELVSLVADSTVARRIAEVRPGHVLEVQAAGPQLQGLRLYADDGLIQVRRAESGWVAERAEIDARQAAAVRLRVLEFSHPGRDDATLSRTTPAAPDTAASQPAVPLARTTAVVEAPEHADSGGQQATPAIVATAPVAATAVTAAPASVVIPLETGGAAARAPGGALLDRIRAAERAVAQARQRQAEMPRVLPLDRPAATASAPTRAAPGGGLASLILSAEQHQHRKRLSLRGQQTGPRRGPGQSNLLVRGSSTADPRVSQLLAATRKHLGVPYLWGGTSPAGFDCSGFIYYHMRKVGVKSLPRTAHQLYLHTRGSSVGRADLQPGDLVFFWDAKEMGRRIGHAGIYIGDGQFIHAVGDGKPVTITPLNKPHYARRFVRGGRLLG